jgi:hypothetical protein
MKTSKSLGPEDLRLLALWKEDCHAAYGDDPLPQQQSKYRNRSRRGGWEGNTIVNALVAVSCFPEKKAQLNTAAAARRSAAWYTRHRRHACRLRDRQDREG